MNGAHTPITSDAVQAPIIRAEGVGITLTNREILQNVNFSVSRGEFVYIIGRTGSGKSTLLRMLYGDLVPTTGSLAVEDYVLQHLTTRQRPYLRRRLGIVFQDFQLLPDRTVAENILFVMRATGWRDKGKITERLTDVLMQVGLSSKGNSMPGELSGGEQQRTVIARALVNDPILLIADEPTGNLDPEVTSHIMDVLMRINLGGTAVVMATHEHSLIKERPARVLECRDGTIYDLGIPG